MSIYSPQKTENSFFGVDLLCLFGHQALVKGGASSQTMAADEFIVGAAQVFLEQV